MAASQEGHREIVELLLEKRPTSMPEQGRRNRFDACFSERPQGGRGVAAFQGGRCQCQEGCGRSTALAVASQDGHREVVELLLAKGADCQCQEAMTAYPR